MITYDVSHVLANPPHRAFTSMDFTLQMRAVRINRCQAQHLFKPCGCPPTRCGRRTKAEGFRLLGDPTMASANH